ncbi:MAG TPA: hypothetical protein VFM05_13185, partial [Candidatus Saccharimonadales bacterium]|nr:hypothetical protein [Candidatus Saccharimonadales bacterium]
SLLGFFRFSSREEEYVWIWFKGRSIVHAIVQILVQIGKKRVLMARRVGCDAALRCLAVVRVKQ